MANNLIKAVIFDVGGVVIIKNKKTSRGYQALNKSLLKFLRKISKNYKIYVLTNIDVNLHKINKKRGIYKNFKQVYVSCEMSIEKPNKKMFLAVLKENPLKPIEILVVDDKEEHLRVAKKLGMKTILFKDNKQFFEDIKKSIK